MTPAQVRERIILSVSANWGHLGSSLGAVEIACALAEVFDPMVDRVLWDVGHQAYAWKILTGRADRFGTLRRPGGIAPFLNPDESSADAFISGHAGTSFAAAAGLAAGLDRQHKAEVPQMVAVVGDAAFFNGESLEALSLARRLKKVVVVLNDNEDERARVDQPINGRIFEPFGVRYIGPVDGHDVAALAAAFKTAKAEAGIVVVHALTRKGKGFPPAEADPAAWHGVEPFDLVSARQGGDVAASGGEKTWSAVFGDAMCEAARRDEKVCAVVAAMGHGTGLDGFAREFPDRFFDVGIREEMAVTFAAGLAKAGLKPVVAIYSTFLQRAVDQIQHDVCLQRLPVVFAIDRAGCVGEDGATHHGLYDIPLLRPLTGMRILAPTGSEELQAMLNEVLAMPKGPVALRYPKGAAPVDQPTSPNDQRPTTNDQLTLLPVGDQVAKARKVQALLTAEGVAVEVVPVSGVKPPAVTRERVKGLLVTLENGVVTGGFGESIGADMRFGWPDAVVGHGPVEALEREFGFDAASVARTILDRIGVKHG